ncbi:MAG: ABC transporter permease [FCB group bacterium]|nr:ABC transporter permease [FCB group bacterium]MBL7028191.1 ABC transporter permease [Candidatus Neomarinimicrobiota bacterium]MBL7122503.1 ABC transporter permease [Candidatus Neomarinimicrobiota bacterium]
MMLFKLAWRNLVGAGLRTWLNVLVLAMAFILMIWGKGVVDGMAYQLNDAMTNIEFGNGGQIWHSEYDATDPLTIEDSHAPFPEEVNALIATHKAAPILIRQGTIYPDGRMQTIMVKGIHPEQEVMDLPTDQIVMGATGLTPALIGQKMADKSGLEVGDLITVRWRDAQGTFDAREVEIVHIMNTVVQTVDRNQIWIPLDELQAMSNLQGQATVIALDEPFEGAPASAAWIYRDLDFLMKDMNDMIKSKNFGGNVMYGILFAIALLAIFDTQVLAIFRRKKEMGTLMALGLTRAKVIGLFTIEGSLHGIIAFVAGFILGSPLFYLMTTKGYAIPGGMDDYGMALGNVIYGRYGPDLLIGTTFLLFLTVVLVSYLPTRKISKLTPTDALRGK